MKVAKVRSELKTIGTTDVNRSATLPQECRLSYIVRVLFDLCHVWQFCSHFLLINAYLLVIFLVA